MILRDVLEDELKKNLPEKERLRNKNFRFYRFCFEEAEQEDNQFKQTNQMQYDNQFVWEKKLSQTAWLYSSTAVSQ